MGYNYSNSHENRIDTVGVQEWKCMRICSKYCMSWGWKSRSKCCSFTRNTKVKVYGNKPSTPILMGMCWFNALEFLESQQPSSGIVTDQILTGPKRPEFTKQLGTGGLYHTALAFREPGRDAVTRSEVCRLSSSSLNPPTVAELKGALKQQYLELHQQELGFAGDFCWLSSAKLVNIAFM